MVLNLKKVKYLPEVNMPNNTTVIGVQEIDAFIRALQSYGITTPEWLVIIILVVILLAKISGYIDNISSGLNKIKLRAATPP